jgi:hypothetical protein
MQYSQLHCRNEGRLTITSSLKSVHSGESSDSTLKQATTDPIHVLVHAVCYSISKPLQVWHEKSDLSSSTDCYSHAFFGTFEERRGLYLCAHMYVRGNASCPRVPILCHS